MKDGVDHINIYSQGRTKLGRFLSNFTKADILTEDGKFTSVEGYWYWLSTKDDKLRYLHGYEAKKYGRSIKGKELLTDDDFKRRIKQAINYKIENSEFFSEFKESTLPFKHYYIYSGKTVEPKGVNWITEYIEELRTKYQSKKKATAIPVWLNGENINEVIELTESFLEWSTEYLILLENNSNPENIALLVRKFIDSDRLIIYRHDTKNTELDLDRERHVVESLTGYDIELIETDMYYKKC